MRKILVVMLTLSLLSPIPNSSAAKKLAPSEAKAGAPCLIKGLTAATLDGPVLCDKKWKLVTEKKDSVETRAYRIVLKEYLSNPEGALSLVIKLDPKTPSWGSRIKKGMDAGARLWGTSPVGSPTKFAYISADGAWIFKEAQADGLIDADALAMIEGVFQVSELSASDILIPRAQIDWIDINESVEDTIAEVIRAAHSRFPVYENNRDNVIGILLAKDLLRHSQEEDFQLRDWLRPAVFIPESTRLSILLKDFREHRNHIAIVVDEYGGVAGLVTIEDVLEQIVGDIEDEHDTDDIEDNIINVSETKFRIRGITELDQVNEALGTNFADEDNDTLAGFILRNLGRVPHKGETITIDNILFEIQRADARQVHVLLATKLEID